VGISKFVGVFKLVGVYKSGNENDALHPTLPVTSDNASLLIASPNHLATLITLLRPVLAGGDEGKQLTSLFRISTAVPFSTASCPFYILHL